MRVEVRLPSFWLHLLPFSLPDAGSDMLRWHSNLAIVPLRKASVVTLLSC